MKTNQVYPIITTEQEEPLVGEPNTSIPIDSNTNDLPIN